MSDLSSNVSCAPDSQRMGSFQEHIQGAHVETHFGSYLSQILMDFISIWVILKLIKIGPKSPKNPNSEGSGSDQNPDRKARELSPDRANNSLVVTGGGIWAEKRKVSGSTSLSLSLNNMLLLLKAFRE